VEEMYYGKKVRASKRKVRFTDDYQKSFSEYYFLAFIRARISRIIVDTRVNGSGGHVLIVMLSFRKKGILSERIISKRTNSF